MQGEEGLGEQPRPRVTELREVAVGRPAAGEAEGGEATLT